MTTMITMYISVEELKGLKETGKGIARTFKNHSGDFEIKVDIDKIDLDTPTICNHYFISL